MLSLAGAGGAASFEVCPRPAGSDFSRVGWSDTSPAAQAGCQWTRAIGPLRKPAAPTRNER